MSAASKLLGAVVSRQSRERWGIGLASNYVKQVAACDELQCKNYFGGTSVGDLVKSASSKLVYANEDMTPESKVYTGGFSDLAAQGIEIPKNCGMVFRNIVTTTRQDRDLDRLHTKGAKPDLAMPLLWQHIQTLPIGKMLKVVEHTENVLRVWSAIVDLNELTADAMKLVEAGALRISHGFVPKRWDKRAPSEAEDDREVGFDVFEFDIVEESLVSVPSNMDAVIELYDRQKLESKQMTAFAKSFAEKNRRAMVPGGLESDVAGAGDAAPMVSLVKGFDGEFAPEMEHLEASSLEYDWVSRHVGVPIKSLRAHMTFVSSAMAGSFFVGMREQIKAWELRDRRNITYGGREVPVGVETIQLNSTQSIDEHTDCVEFYVGAQNIVVSRSPSYGGYGITVYAGDDIGKSIIDGAWLWARENNFLKGEAFRLTGEFIPRETDLDIDSLYLSPENKSVVSRLLSRINEHGAAMDARGAILMGPPGTGKTLSGRVLCAKANATFIWVTAKDMYRLHGATNAFTRALKMAQELAPAIVMVEDCDHWIGRADIDVLKGELDGLIRRHGCTTIMTTNYPEALPSELIDRPGRFHDIAEFSLPSKSLRAQMLRDWTKASDELISSVAEAAEGMSHAHIWELAKFAESLEREFGDGPDKALNMAINKLAEQRRLLGRGQQVGRRRRNAESMDVTESEVPGDTKAAGRVPTKAGRVISEANAMKIREAADDIEAVYKASKSNSAPETQLERGHSVLLKRCREVLLKMLQNSERDDDNPSKPDGDGKDKQKSAVELGAAFLLAATPAERMNLAAAIVAEQRRNEARAVERELLAHLGS